MKKYLIALGLLASSSLANAATVELPFTGYFGSDAYGVYSPGEKITGLITYDDESFFGDPSEPLYFGDTLNFTTSRTSYDSPVVYGFYDPADGFTGFSGAREYPLVRIEFSGVAKNLTRPPSLADLLNIRGSFSFDDVSVDPDTEDFSFSGGTGYLYVDGSTVGAVPEPASWAMMILGMGALAATTRYRRRKTSIAFG